MSATAVNETRGAHLQSPADATEPRTLGEMFVRSAARHAKPDALNYKRDGRWQPISSAEMIERGGRIALGLHSLGLRRNDRAAILSPNCAEWTLADAGCLFAGIISVPIYTTQAPPQVQYILADSGARVLFLQNAAAYERLASALDVKDTKIEHIIFLESEDARVADNALSALTLDELEERGRALRKAHPGLLEELMSAVAPDDLVTIIYTSGTTGEPKGVMLTQTNLISNLLAISHHLNFTDRDMALSVLPLSHVYERVAMYMNIHLGLTVYYAEALEKIADNLREVRPTLMIGVPRLFEKIYARARERAVAEGKLKTAIFDWAIATGKDWARLKLNRQHIPAWLTFKHNLASRLVYAKWRAALGGRLRLFVSGGAALPEEIGYIYAGAGMPIVQGYGLTETSPVIAACQPDDNRIGTVGRAIADVEVRIADDGEIQVRGPNVMRGYYNKPEATRAVFTDDGWFMTGDIGALDPQGYLRITDRKKELLKTSGGKYIAPQPIEQLIKASRFVNQVVLVGDGRRFPAALIVPDWERLRAYAALKGIDAREAADFCQHPRIINLFERQVEKLTTDLAQFERVKKIALLEHEFTIEGGELTPTLKVKRRVVDEKYRRVIDDLYKDESIHTTSSQHR